MTNKTESQNRGGRPSKWRNQPTETIRVPSFLVSKLLEIAQALDKGLKEVLIIEPETLNVSIQSKTNKLELGPIRLYQANKRPVIRVDELVQLLSEVIEQKNK